MSVKIGLIQKWDKPNHASFAGCLITRATSIAKIFIDLKKHDDKLNNKCKEQANFRKSSLFVLTVEKKDTFVKIVCTHPKMEEAKSCFICGLSDHQSNQCPKNNALTWEDMIIRLIRDEESHRSSEKGHHLCQLWKRWACS